MRITADTNVLVRAMVADHPAQAKLAQETLEKADRIAVSSAALCELVWVLARGYGIETAAISQAIRGLINSANVDAVRPAVEAGLAMLDAGGDFADGIIAYQGAMLGGETFVSFDKAAVKLLDQQGTPAILLR